MSNSVYEKIENNSNNNAAIIVMGPTAAGKTDTALSIAASIPGAEIINADVMQMFKGLDIATNKHIPSSNIAQFDSSDTKNNLYSDENTIVYNGIRHHLFSVIDPLSPNNGESTLRIHHDVSSDREEASNISVQVFKEMAMKKIREIYQREGVPIIVGGSHFYLRALLTEQFLIDETQLLNQQQIDEKTVSRVKSELDRLSKTELYSLLEKEDPATANKLHPNNTRKIYRALEVKRLTGKNQSDIFFEQQKQDKPTFCCSALVYVAAKTETLEQRIDDRVDSMIKNGLLEEISEFWKESRSRNIPKDYTKGILQSIGFKEFEEYLSLINHGHTESNKENVTVLDKARNTGAEQLKINTRRYAKKQMKYIRSKILPLASKYPHYFKIFPFDSSDKDLFKTKGLQQATRVVSEFLFSKNDISSINVHPDVILRHNVEPIISKDKSWEKYYCDLCNRTLNGQNEWQVHLKSKAHKAMKKRQNKKDKIDIKAQRYKQQ